MTLREKDRTKILRLVREGKRISLIWREYFPEYDYWEIYNVAYDAGVQSAVGAKRSISARLKKLSSTTNRTEKQRIIAQVGGLVYDLYENHKANQKKFDQIRKIIG